MINLKWLENKTVDDLLRDRVWLLNNMKKVANAMWFNVESKWLWKFRNTKLTQEQQAKWLPSNYPELLCILLDTLDVYITTKQNWHSLKATQYEKDLFKQFELIEQNYNKSTWK